MDDIGPRVRISAFAVVTAAVAAPVAYCLRCCAGAAPALPNFQVPATLVPVHGSNIGSRNWRHGFFL